MAAELKIKNSVARSYSGEYLLCKGGEKLLTAPVFGSPEGGCYKA